MSAAIAGMGTATPPPMAQQDLWDGFFRDHFGDDRRARAAFRRAGIERRGGVVRPTDEDVSGWGTERRMQRFLDTAMPLGRKAIEAALADSGRGVEEIDQLTVVTCTGYGTPGLDVRLADDLGMAPTTQRLHIGHMGCYAAIPALGVVGDAARARRLTGLLLCVELSSLHVQPPTDDTEQMVAHALFADAAAAVVMAPGAPGLELVDVVARTDTARAGDMRWDVTDHGFRMGLAPSVPDVLARHVRDVVRDLLAPHDLDVPDVAGWAVHPGGPRIVDVVADRLALDGDDLAVSRRVLRDHGNCSSATVLLILQCLVRERPPAPGDHVVAMAFGPGLTLYAALLRATGGTVDP